MQVWLLWLWAVIRKGNHSMKKRRRQYEFPFIVLLFKNAAQKHSESHMWTFLQPSEQNTYADIEAAYKCLEENYGTKQDDIILYGQSVGSGPTLDLAARLPKLRAVILHSPILSGLRVMYPVKRTYWFDIYKVEFLFIDL